MTSSAPIAERIPHAMSIHGHTRNDPYFWLRDDERKDPKILDYLNAENAYTKTMMEGTATLQETLYNELVGRLKKDDSSVPVRRRSYWYYSRFESGKEYPIYCRRKGTMDAPEEIILDVNDLAKGHAYYAVGGLSISEDEQRLAFAEDTVSRRLYTIRVKDLKTGQIYADSVPGTSGSIAWSADNETFFYVDKDDTTLRPYRVRRHTLGTSHNDDVTVHDEQDESFYVGVHRSKSRQFIMISMQSTLVSETRILEADNPTGSFRPVLARAPKTEYDVYHHGETFYIRINRDAPNFKLVAAPVTNPADTAGWREVIAHRPDVLLLDVDVFSKYLVVSERRDAIRRMRILPWSGEGEHDVAFDEPVHVAYPGDNPEFETELLRFVYSSPTTPNSVFEYNMATKARTLLKRDKVLGGFEPTDYQTHRVWAKARDGEKIPVSLVVPKGFKQNGEGPLYLYAYGSYGYSMDPWFSSTWLSLLDRGIAVGVAHIRGGQEMGRRWYDNGKMEHKMNTFTDFIDVSEHLIAQGWTNADKLVAAGGSAGGLLMGAIANIRPELYKVIHAAVPFVDVVSTMLDDSIPLTTGNTMNGATPMNRWPIKPCSPIHRMTRSVPKPTLTCWSQQARMIPKYNTGSQQNGLPNYAITRPTKRTYFWMLIWIRDTGAHLDALNGIEKRPSFMHSS